MHAVVAGEQQLLEATFQAIRGAAAGVLASPSRAAIVCVVAEHERHNPLGESAPRRRRHSARAPRASLELASNEGADRELGAGRRDSASSRSVTARRP